MNRLIILSVFTAMFIGLNINVLAQTQEVYDEGTVWVMTFVRTGANADEEYLKGIKQTWEANMMEQVKAGLIKSYKIMKGLPANDQDFNILLMIEYANYAAFDPNDERRAAARNIDKMVEESMKGEFQKTVTNYENIRKIRGVKAMREITLN